MPTVSLTVEHGLPLGVGTTRPRLSFQVTDAPEGWAQAAYEVSIESASGSDVRRVDSADSVLVPWPFAVLESRQRCTVRVRAYAPDGTSTEWSPPEDIEAALLDPADWSADMVAPTWEEDETTPQPPFLIRREFDVATDIVRARLYVTAHGVYRAHVNGEQVSDAILSPGWSAYRKRLRYQTYDVTPLLSVGANAIGITVADGWFRGFLAWDKHRNWYGTRSAAFAQLEITYADGSRDIVATDPSWRVSRGGPIRSSDIYMGEEYDARLEADVAGWTQSGFDDSAWEPSAPQPFDPALLTAQASPLVRPTETLLPVEITAAPSGAQIVDFGQNLVGHLRLDNIDAAGGDQVVLRHAEILQGGELCTEPLRAAKQTDTFIAAGGEKRSWAPQHTFHGFRYAEVTGWPRALSSDDVTAVVTHSDMRRTGWFHCDHPLLNRLHENALWSMRGNFVDVPTDCPQRDERLGWTGDLQVFTPSASFLYDCLGLLDSWLADLACEQRADGGVPFVVPNPAGEAYKFASGVPAAWADAAVVVPWVLYERFGDRDLLARQFPSMASYVDACVKAHGPELNPELFQFGDWLDPTAPPDKPREGQTETLLVAGAYLVHSLDIMAETARVLGRNEDVAHYEALAADYRATWRRRFQRSDGKLTSDSPTGYALAICFQLLATNAELAAAGDRLATLIADGGRRIATGFVGTPLVCDALTSTGHIDDAYTLLLQTECPSFLYPVMHGATTIWERWDSLTPEGVANDPSMTSFNHYALGAVVDWMHRTVAGIAPLEPGYRSLWVRPLPGGGLLEASATHLTPYGEASVSWRLAGDQFVVDVCVPPSSSALLDLPIEGWEPRTVSSGSHRFSGRLLLTPPEPRVLSSGAGWSAGGPAARQVPGRA